MTLAQIFDFAGAAFAVAAAVLWIRSASIKTPPSIVVATEIYQSGFDGSIGGSSSSTDLEALGKALIRQSRWSGYAAWCAAVAAILSAAALVIGPIN